MYIVYICPFLLDRFSYQVTLRASRRLHHVPDNIRVIAYILTFIGFYIDFYMVIAYILI